MGSSKVEYSVNLLKGYHQYEYLKTCYLSVMCVLRRMLAAYCNLTSTFKKKIMKMVDEANLHLQR